MDRTAIALDMLKTAPIPDVLSKLALNPESGYPWMKRGSVCNNTATTKFLKKRYASFFHYRFAPSSTSVRRGPVSLSVVEMTEKGPLLKFLGDRSLLREDLSQRPSTQGFVFRNMTSSAL